MPKKSKVNEEKEGKRKRLTFYVTEEENATIERKAAQVPAAISEYCRQMALFGAVRTRFTEEEKRWIVRLIEMSNGLTVLIEQAEKQGVIPAMVVFIEVRGMIDELLKKFTHGG